MITDTPRAASWMRDDTQLDNWVAFLYFQRGTVMLYSGMEYAPKERVDFFENQSNYGDRQRDMQLYLRKLKELKQTQPISLCLAYSFSYSSVWKARWHSHSPRL